MCQVVCMDSDGTKELGERIELPPANPFTGAGEPPTGLNGGSQLAADNVDYRATMYRLLGS